MTARKHPEDISSVPLSVRALPGSFLDRRDLSSLYDLQFEIPGLVLVNRGMFGAGLALRGVTDEGGASLAIAPHINGIYLGRSNLALARQFDVERVEVVKGPQGTLYGRNATGGSINVITRAPEQEFSAAVEGAYGSFDTARVRGFLNLPGDELAVRFAAAGSAGDGYIRNTVDDRRFAEQDYAAARVSLRARPGSALTIDLMAQRVEDDGASDELWLPRKDFLPDPEDIRLTTVTLADPYMKSGNDLVTFDLTLELDKMTLRSLAGYARNLTRAVDDCAGFPRLQGCVRAVQPLRYEERSQELRLESNTDGSVQWIVGAFYFDGNENQHFSFSAPLIAPTPINDYMATADRSAYALFGDATYTLGERWSVSSGLRFSRESHRVADAGSGTDDNATLLSADGTWRDTSWQLGLEYSLNPQTLVYAKVSTGFKSGGITTELLPNGQFDGYDPERLTAYETGISANLTDRRTTLRASVFYYDFEDMQVQTIALLENRVTSVIDNATAAHIYGLDVSASMRLSSGITFAGALVWLPRREFDRFADPVTEAALSGNTISRAPEWSASASIGYRLAMAQAGEFSWDIDFNYRSDIFFTKENDPILSQENYSLVNALLRFDSSAERWYVFASARNLFDTDYFNQAFIQSSPGYPTRYEIGFGLRY